MALRSRPAGSFLFFCLALNLACTQKRDDITSVIWKDNSAVAIVIPEDYFQRTSLSTVVKLAHVRLKGEQEFVLGEFEANDGNVFFKPTVPLSRGLTYQIVLKGRVVTSVKVPGLVATGQRSVAVYPSSDTVPENLLKIYLSFTSPMQADVSEKYVSLIENDRDTINAFLALKPELWNKEGTTLTLWLDPSRIKRDLIPNRTLGSPLKRARKYTLIVSANWRTTDGLALTQGATKHFITSARDDISPDPQKWEIASPSANKIEPLKINFREPLDYSLLSETIKVYDSKNRIVGGIGKISERERVYFFVPEVAWRKGEHVIKIEERLEDLAGNNLNRPFERVITSGARPEQKPFFQRKFLVL